MSRLRQFLGLTQPSSRGMTSDEASMVREIQAHDLAESKRNRRIQLAAEWAKNQEIPLEVLAAFDRPFPGNTFSVTTHKAAIGAAGKLAIAAALATGTGGAGLGLWAALRPVTEKVVKEVLPGTDMTVVPGETILE